ncbi:hypothetical protein D3C74_243100 [compost metagenome]
MHPQNPVQHGMVLHHHALRFSRGAGGIDDIGYMVWPSQWLQIRAVFVVNVLAIQHQHLAVETQ